MHKIERPYAVVAAVIIIVVGVGCSSHSQTVAADFTLPSLSGQPIALSDFNEQPVVINFWASWCGPCRFEMPELAQKYDDFRAAGLVVLGVNVTSQDSIEGAAQFVEDFDIPFPILLDEAGEVEALYNASSTPTTIFVNADGIITNRHFGPMTDEQIDGYIRALVDAS